MLNFTYRVTVDLLIFACLDFREFVILGLLRSLEFANYRLDDGYM